MNADLRLDKLVRSALADRRGQWAKIATDCSVSHSWISKFVCEKIPNPGFTTLKRLHQYLEAPARGRKGGDKVQPEAKAA